MRLSTNSTSSLTNAHGASSKSSINRDRFLRARCAPGPTESRPPAGGLVAYEHVVLFRPRFRSRQAGKCCAVSIGGIAGPVPPDPPDSPHRMDSDSNSRRCRGSPARIATDWRSNNSWRRPTCCKSRTKDRQGGPLRLEHPQTRCKSRGRRWRRQFRKRRCARSISSVHSAFKRAMALAQAVRKMWERPSSHKPAWRK
jgi:hypothetical protein